MSAENDRAEIRKDISNICDKIDDVRDEFRDGLKDVRGDLGDIKKQLPGDADLQTKDDCRAKASGIKNSLKLWGMVLIALIFGSYGYAFYLHDVIRQILAHGVFSNGT